MARFRALLRWVGLAEIGAGVFLLGAIVCLIFYQVTARYVFGAPEAWIEELCAYAFIWLVFLGAGAAMKLDRHIRVTSLEARAGPRGKMALRWLGALVTVAALAVVGFHAGKFFPVELRSSSVALPVNLPRALFFSLPLMWACASASLSAIYILLRDLREIKTGKTHPPLFIVGAAREDDEDNKTDGEKRGL